jgi:putative ABC transport system ATP-binding protein
VSILVTKVSKSFSQGRRRLPILRDLDLAIKTGESVAVVGQSGSGKSTLLSLLAGLDRPDSGEVHIAKTNLNSLSEADLTAFRGQNIGIVFQQFHLMPHLTAIENVGLPKIIAGEHDWHEKAKDLLQAMGLNDRDTHYPAQLSGGECQRVAIARALITNPKLVLADEPTGNLDIKTAESVIEAFFQATKTFNVTVLLVTHNDVLARRCDRCAELREGLLWF